MSHQHVVQQGESLLSLARQYGTTPEKIEHDPANRFLREGKRTTSILYPGDEITIPDREQKSIDAVTEQRHRFRCHGTVIWLRLALYIEDEPRRDEPYELVVDGVPRTGQLDSDGRLEEGIPASSQQAILKLGDDHIEEMILDIGYMDPIEETSGVQKRLNNLGFYCGAEDGEIGDYTRQAIRDYQLSNGLEGTGELDEATKTSLEESYGC